MGNQRAIPVYEYFAETVQTNRNRPALVYLGTIWTYGSLHELIERFGASLYELGLRKGDRAVLYLANTPQWIISWFGMQRIGVIPVPISPIYTPADLVYLVNDTGADTIVCLDTNFGYVEEVFDQTCLKRAIVTNMVELLPLWKRLLGKAFNTVPEGKYSLREPNLSFKRLLKAGSRESTFVRGSGNWRSGRGGNALYRWDDRFSQRCPLFQS